MGLFSPRTSRFKKTANLVRGSVADYKIFFAFGSKILIQQRKIPTRQFHTAFFLS